MDSRPFPPDISPSPPRFDVFIRLPRGMSPEDAERRVVELGGLTPEQGARIAAALRQVSVVQVRRSIDETRARKTEHQLSMAGLRVEVKRLPSTVERLRPAEDDPEEFEFDLHDVSDEEAALYSLPASLPPSRPPHSQPLPSRPGRTSVLPPQDTSKSAGSRPRALVAVAAVAIIGVAGVAFLLGRMSLPFGAMADAQGQATQSIDKVLVTVGAPPALPDSAGTGASAVALVATDDTRDGESLLQLARADRAQGRASSLEQAVAQAQGGQAPAAGLLLPGDRLPASLAQAATGPTSAGPAVAPEGAPSGTVPPLPMALRATLMADLAVQLAEFGQAARAREVLGRLRADAMASGDPAVSASAQRAEVMLLAWSLRDAQGSSVDRGIASLRSALHAIESPAARAALLGRVATVLARHDNVPESLALACLADAGEALKSVADGAQRQAAIDDWLVDTGDLLLSQMSRSARLGRWSQAQSLAGQLDTLAGQARSTHAVIQLQALRARAQDAMGQPAKGEKLLADALKTWNQHGSPARQADELRELARRAGDMASPELFQMTAQLATAADSLRGPDRARTLTSLALMQAEAGETERFEAIKAMLRQSPDSARPEQAALTAQLLVGGELAAARAEQRTGAFGMAEARVRKVAAYLL